MISFVLFSQAWQPNMNLIYRNWSLGLAWFAEILVRLQNTTKINFPYVGDQPSQVKKFITSPTRSSMQQ